MNKFVRIPVKPGDGDKFINVKLEQDVDMFEILSLKISQKDIYASFNGDYGVLIGRVIANGDVGIPNAKVSIFIPISDEDKLNSDILSIYPYSTPRDKNLDGVRYNLLPRVGINNPFILPGEYLPVVPIGTFPTKEELSTNQTYIEVFEKYYKYTTITNTSGDYMIYGAPIGSQTVHMSVDITDIGKYSMTCGTMITNLGYSPNLFTDNGTKVKFSTDLDTLPNVETQEIAVDIRPFWGDETNFEIGLTLQNFKIRATLINTFTIFGSAFTDARTATFGRGGSTIKQLYAMYDSPTESSNLSIGTKRNGLLNEKLFYLPNTIDDATILANTFDPKAFVIMDQSEYTRYVENGQFVYIVPCNRRKVITNEFGNEVVVANDNPTGIFTEFNGCMVLDYSDESALPIDRVSEYNGRTPDPDRFRFKIPQTAVTGTSAPYPDDTTHKVQNDTWRRQNKKFTGGMFYSVARFHGISNSDNSDNEGAVNVFTWQFSSGAIATDVDGSSAIFQYPTNGTASGLALFGVQWMNFSIYFPQYTRYNSALQSNLAGRSRLLNVDNRTTFESNDNAQLIVGSEFNTKHMGRADLNSTDFIDVPKEDILNIIDRTLDATSPKGFRSNQSPYTTFPLIGSGYKSLGSVKYFYKGLGDADSFLFLKKLNLI